MTLILAEGILMRMRMNELDRISVSNETSYWLAIVVNDNWCGWLVRASVQLCDLTFDLPSPSPIHINALKFVS